MNTPYSGTGNLHDSEFSLTRYNKSILNLFKKRMDLDSKLKEITVCDFGAGVGTFANLFINTYDIFPTCIEHDTNLVKILKENKLNSFTKFPTESAFDVIYTCNVLEHIENDQHVLLEFFEHINDGGRLLIYVPAFPFLFSDMDEQIGHYRRYTKADLVKKVKSAGFQIQVCHYHDTFGILASLLLKIFGFNRKNGLGSKKTLLFYDKVIFPISNFLDFLGFRFIFGKNLFVYAIKPLVNKLD
jgi:SAM-dependent methyltransferase